MIKSDIGIFFIFIILFSCQNADKSSVVSTSDTTTIPTHDRLSSEINTAPVSYGSLEKKLILNGTIQAHNKVALKFDRSGILNNFNIRNGDYIKKGEVIATLDQAELVYDSRQLKTELEQAILDRDERIMLLGGEFGKDSSITKEQLEYVEIKSGVRRITEQLSAAQYQLSRMSTYSPYSGIASDVMVRQHQIVSAGEPICTLIDPSSYEAVFDALESSISDIFKGQKIKIIPLATPLRLYTGYITRINPVVNANGLVNIKARIAGNKNKLLEGQKIRIEIITKTEPMIIIPKKALVLRSGKSVVFTYDALEQLAKWNYVTVAHENDTQLGISEGLNQDDIIIIEGNLNLDHDARVVVVEEGDEMREN